MTSQRQDLVLFSNQSVIPSIQDEQHRMFLITSTGSSGPQWLINAFVETHSKGSPQSLNGASGRNTNTNNDNHNVMTTILSLVHGKEHYTSNFQKLQINSNEYNIVDCMTDLVMKQIPKYQGNKLKLLQSIVDQIDNNTRQVIILDQPEFLLSLVAGLTADELFNHFINLIWRKCRLLIINNNVDMFQDGVINDNVNRDFVEFQRFVTMCHYKAAVILNLRPLATGHAKDITGTLKITRGGVNWDDEKSNIHVVENEYLYLTEKDSTRLFYG
ncbi:elongator complex protein 6 [Monosporozyma unispora]|nr:hypothetical protein C6P44_005055 [Kazachstania unispora]